MPAALPTIDCMVVGNQRMAAGRLWCARALQPPTRQLLLHPGRLLLLLLHEQRRVPELQVGKHLGARCHQRAGTGSCSRSCSHGLLHMLVHLQPHALQPPPLPSATAGGWQQVVQASDRRGQVLVLDDCPGASAERGDG